MITEGVDGTMTVVHNALTQGDNMLSEKGSKRIKAMKGIAIYRKPIHMLLSYLYMKSFSLKHQIFF